MALPDFGPLGDLAPGVYRAELHEVLARFGSAVGPRGRCTRDLAHAYELARRTGHLKRFLVFGSYVTAKPDPNDVDIILVMIANDEELAVTQQRITQFQSWLAQIRQRARPEEFEGMASGYRLEVERMQAEVMEYLLRPLPVQREKHDPSARKTGQV